MSKHIDITSFIIAVVTTGVWLRPDILSSAGVGITIAWVYGILLARVLRTILQYGIIKWGFNRYGVTVLGSVMAFFGIAIAYWGWQESMHMYIAIGWIIGYAGFDSAYAAYGKRTRKVYDEMINNAQYAVVALFALALFGGYIVSSPVGKLGIEYQGLAGESLLFLAMVLFWSQVVHESALYVHNRLNKWLK